MDDVVNEIRILTKRAMAGSHRNLVQILRHGILNDERIYFLDAEYCDGTLGELVLSTPIRER